MVTPASATALLVGFGPFPGAPRNPSADIVRALGRLHRPALTGTRIVSAVLPTTYAAVASKLPALLRRHDPDLVLFFGLAGRARAIHIETRAVRTASRLHPDAAGMKPPAVLFPDAPPHIAVRAPVRKLVAAARTTGVPARLSRDAGRYICNASLFACLDTARRNSRPARVAFVHVPPPHPLSPVALATSRTPTLQALTRAGEAVLLALLRDLPRD